MKAPATELDVIQGESEWLEARLGKATASRFADILTTIRTGEAAARRNYRAELVSERLTNRPYERYRSKEMEHGSETEELARVEYILKYERQVKTASFFLHNKLPAGASPDGLVGDDGLIEIKCRNLANHIDSLKTQEVPKEYIPQIYGQLWMTGRAWCDFISFAEDLPPNAQMFVKRVMRDDLYIKELQAAVELFLDEVAEDIKFIENYEPAKQKELTSALHT